MSDHTPPNGSPRAHSATSHDHSHPRRHGAWRWIKRGLLGTIGLVVVVVGVALALVHTDWGRDKLRGIVEAQLQSTFVGGFKLGKIEGSPFGVLTLRDLVINGPDKQPAISVKQLDVDAALLPLISHQVTVLAVKADGVDVDLRRNPDGTMQISQLTKKDDNAEPSSWSIHLPKIALRDAHVQIDTGKDKINLDGVTLDARASMPHGEPIDASVELTTNWRERQAVALAVEAVVHSGDDGLRVPYLQVHAGDVSVIGANLSVVTRPDKLPVIGGGLIINASAAAVARLEPSVVLPDDIAISLSAHPNPGQPWTDIALAGSIGKTPIQLSAAADLDGKQARGELSTGTLDLTKLSQGKIQGTGAANIVFNARPGGDKALPVATAKVTGWGEVAGIPKTNFEIALDSAGERANAIIKATGQGVDLAVDAKVRTVGELLDLEAATIKANVVDPAQVSGGKAPIHGSLHIDLAAHGTVKPTPSLAVTGTIDGKKLRMQDISIAKLHVAVDAARLPSRPLGKAHVDIVDLVRQNVQFQTITLDAADQKDGKVAVKIRTRPKQNPWLFDLDAMITPPAVAAPITLAVDIQHHRIRAGNGSDWTGSSGRLEVGTEQITIRDFRSASAVGHLAVDGFFNRAGKRQGDFRAKLDANGISLASFASAYHGQVDAHVEVGKHGQVWDGDVEVEGKQIQLDPSNLMIDTHTHVALHGTKLEVKADATSLGLGNAKVDVEMDTPMVVTDARAWKKLKRDALREARLTLQGVQVRRIAELAGMEGDFGGRIDGDFQVTKDTIGGRLEVHDVVAPQLRGLTGINAQLDLSQTSPTELAPHLVASVDGIGRLDADAQIQMPANLIDAKAWSALGKNALKGASLKVQDVTIDPAMLDRFGVASDVRAKLDVAVDVGAGAEQLDAKIDVADLRGAGIVQPIDVHLKADVADAATTSQITVATAGAKSTPLIQIDGKLPGAPDQLIAKIKQWRAAPDSAPAPALEAKVSFPQVSAPKLLAVFGRTEITDGKIDGGIAVTGTLAKPIAKIDIKGLNLTVPPGRGGKPVRTVKDLAITGGWDGTTAKVSVKATEDRGGTLDLGAEVQPAALKDGKVTLVAKNLDLAPILAFAPGPAGGASGELDADLHVTGLDPKTMQLGGELHLTGARLPVAPAVGTLRQADIHVVIAQHQITLNVAGKLGQGTLKVDGSVALDGAAPSGGKAKITLNKVSPIGSVEPQISADIDATLSRNANQWKANLVVNNGKVIVPKDKGEKLKPVGGPDDMRFVNGPTKGGADAAAMKEGEVADPVFLVAITLHPTQVESEEFRGTLRGKMEIKASGDTIGITGGIDADSGDLDLFSKRYQVERAGVHFDGPLDPLLDVRIVHDYPDFTAITMVRGRLSKPELVLTSDPGTYSQGELLGFLLGGDPSGDPKNSTAQNKAQDAGTSFVANKIGGYVKNALPVTIDVLRYESATATSSAAVTFGTWISHTLFLSYRQHLESRPDENTGEGSLEYWITQRTMVEGTAGDKGYHGVDLLWRKHY